MLVPESDHTLETGLRLRKSGLAWHSVGDEVVVLDVEQSVYLKLNRSARVLWEQLDDPCDVEDLQRALVQEYGIDPASARRDIQAFLAEMRRRGLLEECRA